MDMSECVICLGKCLEIQPEVEVQVFSQQVQQATKGVFSEEEQAFEEECSYGGQIR